MLYTKKQLKPRGTDGWGSGEYGAPRGERTHNGIDLVTTPGDEIYSPIVGRVTKHGYPYSFKPDDPIIYRYVEVTDYKGFKHRVFYIEPVTNLGLHINTETVIGITQDIAGKYSKPDKKMKNHLHYEIKTADGYYINPKDYEK